MRLFWFILNSDVFLKRLRLTKVNCEAFTLERCLCDEHARVSFQVYGFSIRAFRVSGMLLHIIAMRVLESSDMEWLWLACTDPHAFFATRAGRLCVIHRLRAIFLGWRGHIYCQTIACARGQSASTEEDVTFSAGLKYGSTVLLTYSM